MKGNTLEGNTAGILAIVDPLNPRTGTDDVLIENNVVQGNNRPNTSTEGDLQTIPSGTGIMNVGGDRFTIRNNTVTDNNTFGVATLSNPLFREDPRIDPDPDNNEVLRNLVLGNGARPPSGVSIPGADLVYDGSGHGNCFSQNVFKTAIPPNIEAAYPCARVVPEPSTASLLSSAFFLALTFTTGRQILMILRVLSDLG